MPKSFRSLYYKWRSKLILWWSAQPYVALPDLSKKQGVLHALEPKAFEEHSTVDACCVRLSVIHPDLARFTSAINQASVILTSGMAINRLLCQYEEKTITLEQLFIDQQYQKHLWPSTEVMRFKQAALTFLALYDAIAVSENPDASHNRRVLAKFEEYVLILAKELVSYTQR